MYYAEQFLSPFSILQHQWSHSHPWSTKIIQPFDQLARNQPVKYFECFSQLCRVVLVFCLATNVHVVQFYKMFTCFLIISMNSSKSSFPFPLTSYSMTRLSTCRLIWDKLEAKTLIGFRLQLWAITILHQSHHHLPISRQNEERSRKGNPPRPRSGFAPSTSWQAAALSLILSHFDPSNNCEGQIIAKERFFG